MTAEAIGLTGDSAAAIKQIELLSEDAEGFLRVVFVQLRSLTAKSRYDLARVLGKSNVDHLLILTSDFSTIEFVLLDKRRREQRGPISVQRIQVVPLSVAVARKSPETRELRTIRRFTWTQRDGLEQFDKLRSVFEAAAFSEDYFCNRALFADHYLLTRLPGANGRAPRWGLVDIMCHPFQGRCPWLLQVGPLAQVQICRWPTFMLAVGLTGRLHTGFAFLAGRLH